MLIRHTVAAAAGLLMLQAAAAQAPEADRRAILAMQGEYSVAFAFDETVVLKTGYERKPAQRSGGKETVVVVLDAPDKLVLQHLLVDPRNGHVTKHWRQDWHYEAASRFEFSADQTWRVSRLPLARTQGTWTQCVYEVSDAPRYCGTGRWTHEGGVSTWTSDTTWRPLPRREYTQRSDYNALQAINRHTIAPGGWTHEQFNTKVQRSSDGREQALVREFGFNDYRKTDAVAFKPAYDYWNATAAYWARVRDRWAALLAGSEPGLHLKTPIDGMALIEPLFTLADNLQDTGQAVADAQIDDVFGRWVERLPR